MRTKFHTNIYNEINKRVQKRYKKLLALIHEMINTFNKYLIPA